MLFIQIIILSLRILRDEIAIFATYKKTRFITSISDTNAFVYVNFNMRHLGGLFAPIPSCRCAR